MVYAMGRSLAQVRVSKGDSMFCHPEHIDREMRRVFRGLAAANYFRAWMRQASRGRRRMLAKL